MQKKQISKIKSLINEKSYGALPKTAQLAFGARCSRRILPIVAFEKDIHEFYEDAIKKVETVVAFPNYSTIEARRLAGQLIGLGQNQFSYGLVKQFTDVYEERMLFKSVSSLIAAVMHDMFNEYVSRKGHEKAFDSFDYAFAGLIGYAKTEYQYNQFEEIRAEFEFMNEYVIKECLDDILYIPDSNEFFLQHYKFLPNTENLNDQTISELSLFLKARIFEYFRNKPKKLYDMDPIEFEHLVKELLSEHEKFDFKTVRHVGNIKNIGADLIATEIDNNSSLKEILIECKRYSEKRKISIGIVRQLNGAIHDNAFQKDIDRKGILVTTSYFTKDAQSFFKNNEYYLSGIDYKQLIDLIQTYDQRKISEFFSKRTNKEAIENLDF